MTRAHSVRYLRSQPTMAFPLGRLLAVRSDTAYVLASDGWTRLGSATSLNATWLTRDAAQDLCRELGQDPAAVDTVPSPPA